VAKVTNTFEPKPSIHRFIAIGQHYQNLQARMSEATILNVPAFENHSTLPIAIVGGGLCGLALAIGLVKHGVNVHIFESAPAFSEVGAGVNFGVNSIAALGLIDARLLEGYKRHATFNADRARDSTFYTMRWGMDQRKDGGALVGDFVWHLDDIWHPERMQEMGVRTRSCIHRARLLEELVALLPDGMTSFGKSFDTAEELDDGTIELRFADGTTAQASALLGCDGIKSRVRDLVCPPSVQPTYAREYAYRAVVPKAEAVKALGVDLVLNGHIYCGYGGYIITYPLEHGELINMVAIAYDDKNKTWDRSDWTVPATTQEIRERFKGWYPSFIELFCQFALPSKWALFFIQHDAAYYKGRVCLVGDSAHATVPHLGAGAGMAMEDAFVLSSLIASVRSVQGIEKVFRAYDAVRRPRTQECIRRSLDASVGYDLMLPDARDDVVALKEHLEESFRWLWHEDLEAQVERAKKIAELS
jgi:salicylate hydroxylase